MVTEQLQECDTVVDLILKPEIPYRKRARHVSRFENSVRTESKNGKYRHRTLGVPQVIAPSPSKFLKKHSRIEHKIEVKHKHIRRPGYPKSLPAWTPVKTIIKDKLAALPEDPVAVGRLNFKKQNVLNVKKLQPMPVKKRYVDTRHGDAHDLQSSGLYPVYVHKKSYGKVPKMVKKMLSKKVIRTDELKYKDLQDSKSGKLDQLEKPSYHLITEEERKNLLNDMKKAWKDMMEQFQSLPFLADTPPKAQRKTRLERDLQQLEKDIEVVEKHPNIYVYSDNEDEQ